MVHVSVKASVQVTGGPTLPVNAILEPESYTFAAAELAAKGSTGDSHEIALLPDGGHVVMLALSAKTTNGAGANVSMTPSHGATSNPAFAVHSTLLISNVGALDALVAGGPRSVTLQNEETENVTVDILVCLAP
jgi:hypothetical protein